MRNDDLLARLAEAARDDEAEERAQLDDRWDALSTGTLPPGEVEALREEAEKSMSNRQAFEAFAPLGEEFRARMVSRLAPSLAPRLSRPSRPAWLARRWRPWAAAALAAAAILLVVLPPGRGPAPLPDYEWSLSGGVRELRSAEPPRAVPVFVPGNRFELVLTPRQAVEGRVWVQLFTDQLGVLRPWSPPVEQSPQGAMRIAGEVGKDLRLPSGEVALIVAVGRPGLLPSAPELTAALAAGDLAQRKQWIAWRLKLIVREEP